MKCHLIVSGSSIPSILIMSQVYPHFFKFCSFLTMEYLGLYREMGKGQVYPRTDHEGPEAEQIIALLFLQLRR